MSNKLSVKQITNDPVALEWVHFCLARDAGNPKEWFSKKKSFFIKNQSHLEKLGFSMERNSIENALDHVAFTHFENLSGTLFMIRIGTDEKPATKEDFEVAAVLFKDLFKQENVAAILHTRPISVQQLSLPQLKKLERSATEAMDGGDNKFIISEEEIDI